MGLGARPISSPIRLPNHVAGQVGWWKCCRNTASTRFHFTSSSRTAAHSAKGVRAIYRRKSGARSADGNLDNLLALIIDVIRNRESTKSPHSASVRGRRTLILTSAVRSIRSFAFRQPWLSCNSGATISNIVILRCLSDSQRRVSHALQRKVIAIKVAAQVSARRLPARLSPREQRRHHTVGIRPSSRKLHARLIQWQVKSSSSMETLAKPAGPNGAPA